MIAIIHSRICPQLSTREMRKKLHGMVWRADKAFLEKKFRILASHHFLSSMLKVVLSLADVA
jgi:hypothetical protein